MWGHYVLHNTSIGLRTIVGGAFAGFGSVAVLVSNGWHLGVVSADMLRVGYAWGSFFPFVVGHAAFELSAVVLA
ncbi:stage II sporulation protein M, partial [Rappaport israeli]|uniref:stage II sporulation protein M n=1 Tax=Rappaport israeli TaxID=1839807 RepID=UPI001E65D12C